MLYINQERITAEQIAKYRKQLQEIFPSAFNTGSPIMVRIRADKRTKGWVYRANETDESIGQKFVESAATKIGCKGYYIEGGIRKPWNYVIKAPTMQYGEKVFSTTFIEIKDDLPIDPISDIEKLIMLYFFNPNFSNNAVGKISAKFEFVVPSKEAEKVIDQVVSNYKEVTQILNKETRMDYEAIKSLYTLLDLNIGGDEEQDRLALYNVVTGNPHFRELYKKHYDNAIVKKDNTFDIAAKVKDARDRGVISKEGENWVFKNESGATISVIAEAKGGKPHELKNLIEYIKISDADQEVLAELMK
jgi:hypothetical protein